MYFDSYAINTECLMQTTLNLVFNLELEDLKLSDACLRKFFDLIDTTRNGVDDLKLARADICL